MFVDLKPQFRQKFQFCLLRRRQSKVRLRQIINKIIQPPSGHHLWVKLTDTAGGDIARIGIKRFALVFLLFVDFVKIVFTKPNFAFHHDIHRLFQFERNGIYRSDVSGEVFTHSPITTGRCRF